ncbi:hypothetical protein JA116_19610 [Morganella morganii]|nr:hypothetical protein [Morganella morganii]QXO42691.1 hypothetical protein CXB74_019740 [Morganella morganii]QXO46284.1 hypothetical protein JC862_18920 [Morganella morganii]QXO50010.1 hypothetical protein JC861_19975 [Morganella morganii]QXO53871.1 hypothetical protein JC830_19980 [Morganella morganii]QXO80505.1 hypothetical protein JA116_19610 [Morganella morganii]
MCNPYFLSKVKGAFLKYGNRFIPYYLFVFNSMRKEKVPVNAINRQSSHETQITGESRNIFQAIADKFVAVVNSCKTFSTGCSTQKDHNIQKACERLAALTLVKPESYTTSEMKESAEKLGMTLPYDTESVSKRNLSAADSIGKLFTLKTTECSAQELHD